jgi:hypothetical protein
MPGNHTWYGSLELYTPLRRPSRTGDPHMTYGSTAGGSSWRVAHTHAHPKPYVTRLGVPPFDDSDPPSLTHR